MSTPAPEPASMRFALDEQQQALRTAAAELFADLSPDQRVVQVEADGHPYDERLWRAVIDAGLIEALLPQSAGGAGLGAVGMVLTLTEQGRRLAPVPLAATAVTTLLAARCTRSPAWLLPALTGGQARIALVTADTGQRIGYDPATSLLSGTAALSWHAGAATHLLVTAESPSGNSLWLVERDRAGVSLDVYPGISGLHHAAVGLDSVPVSDSDRLCLDGDPADDQTDNPADDLTGDRTTALLWEYTHLAIAAVQLGVGQEALRRTARYTSEREQFGRPLATNQGVALRAADAYIDTEAVRLTLLYSAWQLDAHGAAGLELLAARWWANEATYRVVHTSQHLHGGMGADTDNHIHRFFLWGRELDVLHGSAPQLLWRLGRELAGVDDESGAPDGEDDR